MIGIKAATALMLLLSAPQTHPGVVGPGVQRAVAKHGSAFVVVSFRARQGRSLAGIRATVRSERVRVLARAGDGFRAATDWDAVPAVAGRVTAAALGRLARDPLVRRIDLDVGGHAADLQADPIIHSDQARAAGYTGNGVTVGILDSGLQENHPDLADALVAEHCSTLGGNCPNHLNVQKGPGSAHDDNGHGTNVAGIITGNGTIAPIGVAPATKVVAVRVLAADGSFDSTSQVITGLQWIVDHPEYGVKVINMSLGTDALFAGTCDNATSFTQAFRSVVHAMRVQGVTLFASAGNQKSTTSMAAPACLSEVDAVGAVYDSNFGTNSVFCNDATAADKVTCFSNSSTALDILAPGAPITSTGVGSSISTYYGTSQASPMVAAAAADLLQASPSLTPEQVESTLKSTGTLITDSRNGRVTPRLDVLAAVNAVKGGNPPPPPPPPPPPDTQAPVVKALAATVKRKKSVHLRFQVSDDSGSSSLTASLSRRLVTVRHWGPDEVGNGSFYLKWTAPKTAQRLSFCVFAKDASGNESSRSCATVKVT